MAFKNWQIEPNVEFAEGSPSSAVAKFVMPEGNVTATAAFEDDGSFVDSRDGKVYKTVKIGDQIWMAENLAFNRPNSKVPSDDELKYGRLYRHDEVVLAAPAGWHIPSDDEWSKLCIYAGGPAPYGTSSEATSMYPEPPINSTYAAIKLKATSGWNKHGSANGNGLDNYGFAGLPAGSGASNGNIVNVGNQAHFWSTMAGYTRAFYYNSYHAHRINLGKTSYASIRCIKDDEPDLLAPMRGTFVDERDGKEYATIKIGDQIWMAENLTFAHPESKIYNNATANIEKYGRLYRFNGAELSTPLGWHIPSDAEWTELCLYVGGTGSYGTAGTSGGKALKAKIGWDRVGDAEGNGLDTYGFAGLPGGSCSASNAFSGIETTGMWWSSSPSGSTKYSTRYLTYNGNAVVRADVDPLSYISVRCIKDKEA